jgi:pimeloyl-ACP methyl ester carboxylesterase/membrane protein DedA with SNARE-associated domain
VSRRRGCLWLYLGALALSHLVRGIGADPVPLPDGMAAIEVAAVAGDRRLERQVRLAYHEWRPAAEAAERPAVVLLHGSPGDAGQVAGLGPLLALRYRVMAPDLPGFGASGRSLPDYSIHAHAVYVRDLLRRLGVDRAHLVGFSLGGGVALELEALEPERVESLVLLSSIGVQEMELLGQYHLNHAVHGLQLAGLWLLYEAVPHFGLLDGGMLDLAYARNFYDSDQRPLRGLLERFEKPMLIVHGRADFLVPPAAAREHHRLVPQSELLLTDAGHFMAFMSPEMLAPPILDFVERVDHGTALRRGGASPERLQAAAGEPGERRISGMALVIAVLLIAVATLVTEDLTCIAAGVLVARGAIGFVPAAAACAAGIFFGDLMLYGVGRLGRPWLERAPLSWFVSTRDVERGTRWFERRGAAVIFLSRFLPGTRLPTYVAAGLMHTRLWWFAVRLFVPVALWTPLLVALSALLGKRFLRHFDLFERYALAGFAATLVVVWVLVALGRSLATWSGRRRLLGWWRRTTRWEFWPRWATYPPVVLYILWLGIRHRCPMLFTAANPGLPAGGGFVGESKSAILAGPDPRWVACFRRIPGGAGATANAAKLEALRDFLAGEGLDYPVVLKPDAGERGLGVAVVRDEAQAAAYFRADGASHALGGAPDPRRDVIVQEYVAGPELGIFYMRLPGEESGRIFSITEKLFPVLVGDGRHSLEHLILADERAVILSPVYLRRHAERLDEVPAEGEEIELVDVGSHSGGTVCRDGRRLCTPALAAAVGRMSRSFEGFYYGRIDFRSSSLDAFRRGEDLKVLEINGVTSEATHVYDPEVRLFEAYRVLCEQWRTAFEIGARNRERGVEPMGLVAFLRLVLGSGRRREARPV